VAAGSVSDYNEQTKTNLQIQFALAARVPPSFVVVQVAAGSVIITALVTVPVGSTATGVTNALTTALGSKSGASSFLGITVTSAPTFTSAVPPPPSPLVDANVGVNPCFPSEALVTMADGTTRRLDALRAGDAIVASRADGTLTTDTVSRLSLADADVQGTTFVVLTTASGRSLTLTLTHHVPVGAACCADLKQAKDIAVGETVYEAVSVSAAVRATQVKKIGTATKPGLHSPVLSHGTMPIVNGVATSFDELHNVRLASYGLPLLEATGLTATFRDAFLGAHRKYFA
jgi:hypothetical protein